MKKKDTICSSCYCASPRLLIHNIWYRNKLQRLCTSCALFTCKEYYCPTCFGVHGLISEVKLVQCKRCKSNSHPDCFKSGSTMCSTCVDPKRLIFAPKELKSKGKKKAKEMDSNASRLLLTAAKVGCLLMSGAWEEKQYYSVMQVLEALVDLKKGKLGVNRAMRERNEDLKNKESLLDFSNSETEDDDEDTCSETLSDGGRMQRLAIEGEGEAVPMKIDLNEECTHH